MDWAARSRVAARQLPNAHCPWDHAPLSPPPTLDESQAAPQQAAPSPPHFSDGQFDQSIAAMTLRQSDTLQNVKVNVELGDAASRRETGTYEDVLALPKG